MNEYLQTGIVLWFIIIAPTISFSQKMQVPANYEDSIELVRLSCESGIAYANRDTVSLKEMTADDYVQTDVRGRFMKKTQWLQFVKNRPTDIKIKCDSIEVRFYNGVAVVTGKWTYNYYAKYYNEEKFVNIATSVSRWTSVWTKYSKGWKRHIFQNTYLEDSLGR
jgi:hypothetical protein